MSKLYALLQIIEENAAGLNEANEKLAEIAENAYLPALENVQNMIISNAGDTAFFQQTIVDVFNWAANCHLPYQTFGYRHPVPNPAPATILRLYLEAMRTDIKFVDDGLKAVLFCSDDPGVVTVAQEFFGEVTVGLRD
jgi:hypothetical protein